MEVDYNYLYGTFLRFIATGDSGASFVFSILFFGGFKWHKAQ